MWEVVFMLLILKIPVAYVGWVVWWAIKAEPEVGAEEEFVPSYWKPWQRPPGSRPRRGGPHGAPQRETAARAARPRGKTT
jgi:hypothetical protein